MAEHAYTERTGSPGHLARRSATAAAITVLLVCLPATAQDRAPPPDTSHRLLVASEDMRDPRFAETVIYMVSHSPRRGALGLIINRPVTDVPRAALQDALDDPEAPLAGAVVGYYGGPVEPGRLFALSPPPGTARQEDAGPPVVSTAPGDLLAALRVDPADTGAAIFTFGYAGWAPGQLAAELARGDWLVIDYDPDLVFGTPAADAWQAAISRRLLDL